MRQLAEFDPIPPALQAAPSREAVIGGLVDYFAFTVEARRIRRRAERAQPDGAAEATDPTRPMRQEFGRAGRQHYQELADARMLSAIVTPTPFAERLVHFWANHFAVSATGAALVRLAGLLEFEAVRPHIMGRFRDMLFAVERHPAMLLYLNQEVSIGPNSAASRPGADQRRGLNENLAREILELHTLGADGGYTQGDVTEFARALTGWTVPGLARGFVTRFIPDREEAGSFYFAEDLHEPGDRLLLGRSYPQNGVTQGEAMLEDIARHPATARHISTKLARHFAGDSPPEILVARLSEAFLETDGDLPALYRVLVESPECWTEEPVKFKTPWEWVVSVYRALGAANANPLVRGGLNELGHRVWTPGSPAGFDDVADSWTGPAALAVRMEMAQRIGRRYRRSVDPRQLAADLFGDTLSARSAQIIDGAESAEQGIALLLLSPEFLRR